MFEFLWSKPTSTYAPSKIVAFGDSLTQQGMNPDLTGWVAALANVYIRRLDVVNRGFSGYNTRQCLKLQDKVFEEAIPSRVALITILLGTNDAVLPDQSQQHVPLDEYKENLTKQLKMFEKNVPKAKVIVIIPPPMHDESWERARLAEGHTLDRNQAVLNKYRAAAKEVAASCKVPTCDIWSAVFGNDDPSSYDPEKARTILVDGLHFNSKGNQILYRCLRETIAENYPDLIAEKLEWVTPD